MVLLTWLCSRRRFQGLSDNFSWFDAFVGNIPGSVGETSVIAIAIAAIILLATGVASYRIILGTIIGMLVMSSILNIVGSDTNPMFQVPWYWHFVISFAFGLVFMATSPSQALEQIQDGGSTVH